MATISSAQFVRAAPPSIAGGDVAVVETLDGGTFAAIIDVLGHGSEANALARGIEDYLIQHAAAGIVGVMKALHEWLRGSRGAAGGFCYVDALTGRLEYIGTGNTVVRRLGRCDDRLVSRDGVLGQTMHRPLEQNLQLEAGDVVLLYTDGVSSHFDGAELTALGRCDLAALARSVVERFGKTYDDAGCVVLRYDP